MNDSRRLETSKINYDPKPNKQLSEISLYRLISFSNISFFAKCLEKFIQHRIVNFLEIDKILSAHQSGFRADIFSLV